MKRSLFIVLALFGLNSFADMGDKGMDHMSNMMGSEGESGLMGAFSLRFKPIGFPEEDTDNLTYRARVGWMGDVNEAVKWAVGFSTATEQNFGGIHLGGINLEQAYVNYSPMEGLSVKVGKSGWMPDFHKSGVLYSEQLYKTGAALKYKHMGWYAKVGLLNFDGDESAPFSDGWTAKLKLGGNVEVSDGMMLGLHVYAMRDGLMQGAANGTASEASKEEAADSEAEADKAGGTATEESGVEASTTASAQTLASVGLNLGMSSMPVPVAVSVNWLANTANIGFNSYTIGLSVGAAGKADSTEMGDFGIAVNYYNLSEGDFVGSWLNEDYVDVNEAAHSGVAVRAQYNPWDKTSFVAKYAHNLDADSSAGNLVAELMFVF